MDRRTRVEDSLLPDLFYNDSKTCLGMLISKKESFIADVYNTKAPRFTNADIIYRPTDFRLWIFPKDNTFVALLRLPAPVRPPQSSYIAAVFSRENYECMNYITIELNANAGFYLCRQNRDGMRMILKADCGRTTKESLGALLKYLGISSQLPPDPPYLPIFSNVYEKLYIILSSKAVVRNMEFELLPAMFVITDYACMRTNKDRHRIGRGLRAYVRGKFRLDEASIALFNERTDFYASVIRGRKLRAECLPGQPEESGTANAVVRCGIALGDILINPECANDYDNAPAPHCSRAEVIEFADLYNKRVIPLLLDLFKQICDMGF